MQTDFRRADPRYVNFVPRTCADAIDLFVRHKNLGLSVNLYPECFVHCAASLKGVELDNFEKWIVQPTGDITGGGEHRTLVDKQLETERLKLLKEAELRDLEQKTEELTITVIEEEDEKMPQDDEKMSEADYMLLSLP